MPQRAHTRRVVQIYDQTGAVGAALDTGVLDVEQFDALIIFVGVAGGPVVGNTTLWMINEAGAQVTLKAAANLVAGVHLALSTGEDTNVSGDADATLRDSFPVPRRIQVTTPASAGITLRYVITGVTKRRVE